MDIETDGSNAYSLARAYNYANNASSCSLDIRRVNVVNALRMRVGHNARRLVLRRLVAKHHGAQAEGGDLEIAFA